MFKLPCPIQELSPLCFQQITVLINFTWQEKNNYQEINSDRVKEWIGTETTHIMRSIEKV